MIRQNERYDSDKEMLNKIRKMNESISKKRKMHINEAEDDKATAIAITDDVKFGDHTLQNQIDSFRQAVNGSAKFAKANSEDPQSNPLVYFPNTGNIVLTGSIPTLSDLKFQFSLNDVTNSPYIFVNGLALTEDVITTINKLRGYYLNWCDEWFAAGEMLEKLNGDRNR